MLYNVIACEIASKHMWLDSRKEGNKLNHHNNEDDCKKRMSTYVSSSMDSFNNDGKMSRADLYSHTHMVLVGKNCTVLNDTGKYSEVAPFTPDYENFHRVPIVDSIIGYDDKHAGETCPLVFYGALLVPSMDHNIVPPLILSEAGLEVDTMSKSIK